MTRPLSHGSRFALASLSLLGASSLLLAACGTGPIPGGSASPGAPTPSSSTSSGCSSATAQSSVTIDATNALTFSPVSVCLKAGGTVTWKNTGNITHTTTDDPSVAAVKSDAELPTGASTWNHTLPAGQSWSLTLTVPGTYKYFCIPHETLGMKGEITVVAAGSSTSAPASTPSTSTSSASCPDPQSSVTVDATNALKFQPADVCLKAGGTVTWKNTGNITHTTTDEASLAASASDAELPSGASPWNHTLAAGQSWSLTLTVPGTYKYFCIPHETLGMKGEITVVAS